MHAGEWISWARAVAARWGMSLPGPYKHVDGLDAVKRDIAVLAVRELTAERLSARPALVAALPRTADGISTSILLQRKARPTVRWQAKPHCLHAESA